MTETRFTVRVSRGNGDWLVTVDCQAGSEYAKALAPHLDVALQMAVPYMAYAAQPDPLGDALVALAAEVAPPRDPTQKD